MIQEILNRAFLGNQVIDYLMCAGYFLGGMIVIKVFEFFLLKRLRKWSELTATTIDDFIVELIRHIFVPLAYFGVFYVSVNTLDLGSPAKRLVVVVGVAVLTIFAARLAVLITNYGFSVCSKTTYRGEASTR